MQILKTIKHIKTINSIVEKIDKIKTEKLEDVLEAIYKLNVAVCYLESIILKAKDALTKLSDKLNALHPDPTPAEEALTSEGKGE